MHAIGTSLVFLTVVVFPYVGAAFSASLALGFLVAPTLFHLCIHVLGMNFAVVEVLVVVGFFVGISNWMANSNLKLKRKGFRDFLVPRFPVIIVMVLGYGFAWIGHFAFENNRPATFLHPTYSLLGDFKMFYNIVSTWKL
jgi:hypothetical protein